MAAEMHGVSSSHVDRIGYDEHARELHVHFKNGSRVKYKDVPKSAYDAVNGAGSVGRALSDTIKGVYDHFYY